MILAPLVGLALWASPKPAIAATTTATSTVQTLSQEIDTYAIKYKVSAALAKRIISCESKNLQSARRVNAHSVDVGLWQLNTRYQLADAQKRGDDIYTVKGNLDYGFWLLSTQGTSPWNWSKYCWG